MEFSFGEVLAVVGFAVSIGAAVAYTRQGQQDLTRGQDAVVVLMKEARKERVEHHELLQSIKKDMTAIERTNETLERVAAKMEDITEHQASMVRIMDSHTVKDETREDLMFKLLKSMSEHFQK